MTRRIHATPGAEHAAGRGVQHVPTVLSHTPWGPMHLARAAGALPIVLVLAACSVRVNAKRGPRPDPAYSAARAEARDAIMQADRDFARTTAARGVEGWLAYFEPNGSQVNGGGTVTTGLAAIRQLMTATFADTAVRLTWEPTDAVVTERGRLGSTVGRWRLLRRDSTGVDKVASTGSYLTVWRKQGDGSWKIVTDVGSPD